MTPEPFHTFFVFMGILTVCFGAGAAFTLGAAVVCRWMQWAPINFTANIHNHHDDN
jgi:hypothetical protein